MNEKESKRPLSGLSLADLTGFTRELELPDFRAKQLHNWIYGKYAGSFEEMSNLSSDLRAKLSELA
ncbi:MAG: 23S rRNA (adenine(2503)-C(2))-methyltransferase RlmN, partial [Candidatus Obscuribacterales bacterium]